MNKSVGNDRSGDWWAKAPHGGYSEQRRAVLPTTDLTGIHLVRASSMQPNSVSTSVKLLDLASTCCVHGIREAVREKQPGAHIIMDVCSKSTTYYSKIASFWAIAQGSTLPEFCRNQIHPFHFAAKAIAIGSPYQSHSSLLETQLEKSSQRSPGLNSILSV